MFKLFGFGIFSGFLLAGFAAWYLPVADLTREASIITVQTNGGNAEVYRVHVPDDRILAAGPGRENLPAGLAWPEALAAGGVEAEIFKLRNRDDVVIGVASRLAANGPELSTPVEWMLHLPARGTMYFPMSGENGEALNGELRAGTREFEDRQGRLQESYRPSGDAGGTIELRAVLVATGEFAGDGP